MHDTRTQGRPPNTTSNLFSKLPNRSKQEQAWANASPSKSIPSGKPGSARVGSALGIATIKSPVQTTAHPTETPCPRNERGSGRRSTSLNLGRMCPPGMPRGAMGRPMGIPRPYLGHGRYLRSRSGNSISNKVACLVGRGHLKYHGGGEQRRNLNHRHPRRHLRRLLRHYRSSKEV